LSVAYTKVVVVSIDTPEVVRESKAALGAGYPILSDSDRKWQHELDLVEYSDPTRTPYIPYSFLLEPGLVIYKIYNGYWFWGRPRGGGLAEGFGGVREEGRAGGGPGGARRSGGMGGREEAGRAPRSGGVPPPDQRPAQRAGHPAAVRFRLWQPAHR